MSHDSTVIAAAFRGIVADDRLVSSSSRGQGSMSCVAEGRVFPPNVMYAVRSLFPLNATMHVFGPYSSAVRLSALCSAHGIEEGSEPLSQYRLLCHVFSGQCSLQFSRDHYGGCVELAGVYEDPASFQQDLMLAVRPILDVQPHSVLQDVANVLGLDQYPASVADVVDSLSHVRPTPPCDLLGDVSSLLDDLLTLPDYVLFAVAEDHGIALVDRSRSFLLDVLSAHLATAACARRLCGDGGHACQVVRDEMAADGNVVSADADVFEIQLLRHLVKRVKLRGLRSLCRTHGVSFLSTDRPGSLRRKLGTYISNLGKSKQVRRAKVQARRQSAAVKESDARRRAFDRIRQSWPSQLSSSANEELVRGFRRETNSERLRSFQCASCTASCPEPERHVFSFADVPPDLFRCPELLRPYLNHAAELPHLSGEYADLLLSPSSLTYKHNQPDSVSFCVDCASSVRRGKCPPLAVANLNFLGSLSPELRDLTFIEEQIIALCRAKCTIVHLKDSSEREHPSEEPDKRHSPNDQRGFKGHIIVYPQRPGEVVSILPPPVKDIISPVCVIFVGAKVPTLEWLRKKAKPLLVRREKVRAALYWLKANNKLYNDVQISEPQLNALPVNDLLPVHVEHVSPSLAQDVLTSRYDAASTEDSNVDADLAPSTRTIERVQAEFSKVVVTDVDGRAPANELRAAAVHHVKEKGGAYVEIPHGPRPVNEFCNPSLFPQMYPCLFPYGIGGFEDARRPSPLAFQRHVRHLLSLQDSRFREHHSFMFTAFNILQCHAILLHSSLKVRKSQFAAVAADYASVSDAAVARVCARITGTHRVQAEDDEERKVLKLMNDVHLVTRQVPGSSGARVAMRNEVRALMHSKGMPTFFITINPADVYNPLVKLLAGADIDVDNLLPGEEPDYWEQSILVARNPVVAARFFHTYMTAFIKTLLKWDPSVPFPEAGVLGVVKAYYGCVEAQGRGTLHCHMLVWVEGGLNPTALHRRLQESDGAEFGKRLLVYLEDLIHTSIPPIPPGCRSTDNSSKRPLTNRGFPLHMSSAEAERVRALDLYNVVSACQRHMHSDTCYKYCDKNDPNKTCRFELEENNVTPESSIDNATGVIVLQHLDGLVNNFNPTVIEAMRCNMDLKFIGTGDDAKALIFYITDYVTKSPLKAHVSYSALEHAMKKFHSMENLGDDTADVAKRLLRKCAFSLTSNQELSGQQVASYLLGYTDNYTSHQFCNLYWPSFERYIDNQLPSPECFVHSEQAPPDDTYDDVPDSSPSDDDFEADDERDYADVDVDEDEVTVGAGETGNLVMLGGQLSDYVYRGHRLENVSLWDFVAQTTKIATTRVARGSSTSFADNHDPIDLQAVHSRQLEYVPFLASHPEHERKLLKVLRHTDRRIPVPIGPALPRRDRDYEWNKYCRLMLLLFKPWRSVSDLRMHFNNWPRAYEDEVPRFDAEVNDIMSNMQLLHECRDSRDEHMKNRPLRSQAFRDRIQALRQQNDRSSEVDADCDLGDDVDLLDHLDMISATCTRRQQCADARVLECTGILDSHGFYAHCGTGDPRPSTEGDISRIDTQTQKLESTWHAEYDARRKQWKRLLVPHSSADFPDQSNTDPDWLSSGLRDQSTLNERALSPRIGLPVFDPLIASVDISAHAQQWSLNKEQTHAFRIIAEHSTKPLPDALRMYIGGPGGTGKSRVIQALTSYFACTNQQRRLRLASYTGIAALHVNGVTLHSALALEQRRGDGPSARTKRDLQAMWEGVDYLFIDEVSMIGCRFLTQISEALADAKSVTERPFGGLSIILAGDFAQLPPVGETRLYAWINASKSAIASKPSLQQLVMGKLLWLTFDTVVLLDESMRQRGPENDAFVSLLGRLRLGECTAADFDLLNSRLLTTCGDQARLRPWRDAPVIVSDNATKDAINEQAARAFAKNTGQQLHWYHASDRYRGKPILDEAVLARLQQLPSGRTAHRLGAIPLVIGMPVIISQNFDVAGGVVNGSIGTLAKIRYTTDKSTDRRHLVSCVIRLPDTTAPGMSGLEDKQFPVLQDTVKMSFKHPYTGKQLTVSRTQVPVQPAFSLTVYKAQGQTFQRVVIDLQGCTGTEAPYVMLSRATSLEGILILRPFDEKKIRCRPSEDYRKVCKRLKRLRMETWIVSGSVSDRECAQHVLRDEFGDVRLRDDCQRILKTMREDAIGTLEHVQQSPTQKRTRSRGPMDADYSSSSKRRR